MHHGVEVSRLDAMDHGAELPGPSQRGFCVAACVAKKKKSRRHRSRRRAPFQNGRALSLCFLSPRAALCSCSRTARLAARPALLLLRRAPRRARRAPRVPGRPPRAAQRAPQPPRSSPRRPAHRLARGASSTAAWAAHAAVRCGRRRAGSRRPPEVIFFNFQFVVGIFL